MAHGGKRASAGRKKGSATRRHAATKAKAVAEGVTPAAVMQKAMEVHFKARRFDRAAAIAKDLAPYVHPRKSPERFERGEAKPLRLVEILVVVDGNGNGDPAPPGQPATIGVSVQ